MDLLRPRLSKKLSLCFVLTVFIAVVAFALETQSFESNRDVEQQKRPRRRRNPSGNHTRSFYENKPAVTSLGLSVPPISQGGKLKHGNKLRILVTGGAGFIGSHLVDRLMEQGHVVIVLDSLFTGKKSNIQKWIDHPRFEFVRRDVTTSFYVEVDQIYHLACPASPIYYKYNPIKTMKTNVMGTFNMLGLAKRVGARFLLTSTSEVYGDPLEHPQKETYWGHVNPVGERSCYDEGKRAAETLTTDFHRQNNVDIRIARIFNTYGPRMNLHDGRVVSNFVRQALNGEELTIQGDGKQTRSFCYVDDMVDALMTLMNTENVVGPVNVGNPAEFTMKELAELVQKKVKDTAIKYVPNTPDDPQQRKPDISKAKEVLGWEPKVPLSEGIVNMANDFRARLANPEMEY